MKAFSLLAAAAAIVLVGCGLSGQPKASITPKTSGPVVVGDYQLGAPIQAENVTIIPVMNTKPVQQGGDEITLAEAKKLGLVEIIEIPGQEEVNRLRVHNQADKPLLLIGGELLLGGKQDRIVVHDVIIPPGKTEDVEVDCVEHGRWEGTSHHFDYSSKIVPSKVRQAAAYKDQSVVWDNVATMNQTAGATVETGTIQGTLNSPEVEKKVNANLKGLADKLAEDKQAIGVIYILNGDIVSMDLFGNPRTFQATKESLLHGFLAEAAVSPGKGDKKPTDDDLRAFVSDSLNNKRQQKGGDAFFLDGDGKVNGNEVRFGNAAAGKLVHGSYSKNK